MFRSELYKDPAVEKFLLHLLESGEFTPTFDLELGYHYPEAEKLLGMTPKEVFALLEKLVKAEILDKRMVDVSIKCPACGSSNVSTIYTCSFCGSPRIERDALIEHLACGYIDLMRNFEREGELVCPKCGQRLGPDSYRSAGTWYTCRDCEKRLESPNPIHRCRDEGHEFTLDTANYTEVYAYSLSEQAKIDIERGILIGRSIVGLLTSSGYNVTVQKKRVGESGIEHTFDIMLEKDGSQAFIDILTSHEPVSVIAITREYTKVLDCASNLYLLVIPGLSEEARKLASFYKFKVVEGANPIEALNGLAKIFEAEDAIAPRTPAPREEAERPGTGERKERKSFLRKIFSFIRG